MFVVVSRSHIFASGHRTHSCSVQSWQNNRGTVSQSSETSLPFAIKICVFSFFSSIFSFQDPHKIPTQPKQNQLTNTYIHKQDLIKYTTTTNNIRKLPNNQQQTTARRIEETMKTPKRDIQKTEHDDTSSVESKKIPSSIRTNCSQSSSSHYHHHHHHHKKSYPRIIHKFQATLKHLPKKKTKVAPISFIQ